MPDIILSADKQFCQVNITNGLALEGSGDTVAGGDLATQPSSPQGQAHCISTPEGYVDAKVVWGDFLDKVGQELSGWDWYCTLTFRDPDEKQRRRSPTWTKPGWGYALRALREFTGELRGNRFGLSQPYWIAMMEYQHHRGVPHWHMLMGNCGNERRMDWVDWWWEGYGIARILPYNQELGARYYLGKYITKEMADMRFSPQLRERHRAVARTRQA